MTHSKSRWLPGKFGNGGRREAASVGRKSRRAQGFAIYQHYSAPDLSRGVGREFMDNHCEPSAGIRARSWAKPPARHGSKPARFKLTASRNHGRAEFLALPSLRFAVKTPVDHEQISLG
jgi:hypothetical protein